MSYTKKTIQKEKKSSSNHPFSGAMSYEFKKKSLKPPPVETIEASISLSLPRLCRIELQILLVAVDLDFFTDAQRSRGFSGNSSQKHTPRKFLKKN